ncbi:MAG: hypothetical protein ACRCZ0_10245 [Cetobacterium sp.]
MIDSLTTTSVYFENKIPIQIRCNSVTNNGGLIVVDEKENPLVSMIDTGDSYIGKIISYSGRDDVMLYNEITKNIRIANVGEDIDFAMDFIRGVRYFFGAKKIKSTSVEKNVFEIPLDGKIPFKVFLEGTDVSQYSVDGDTITVTGSGRVLIDEFSTIIVYAYEKTNLVSGDELVLVYQGFDTVWDEKSFSDGSYFESFRGAEIKLFENVNINQTVEKIGYRKSFMNGTRSVFGAVSNVIDMATFSADDHIDLVREVGSSEFRMIFNNATMKRVLLVNNCKIDNGLSISLEKEKNQKRFNVSCGNYIDIETSTKTYGYGDYGKGKYGGSTSVINSARR